jgi:phosphoglycerate-specific signal transduction histidine kinase
MDLQTVEQQYNQLQQEAQGVMQSLQTLAGKLKTAADGGNQDAREWLLDLKELALNIQTEQQQVMNVMQALHQAVQNDMGSMQGQGQWQPGYPQAPQPSMPPQGYGQPQYGQQPQQGGGFLSSLENSGFGKMLMMGAGFGIGDDLINSIF